MLCIVQVCILREMWRGGSSKRSSGYHSVIYAFEVGQAVILDLDLAGLSRFARDDSDVSTEMPPQSNLGGPNVGILMNGVVQNSRLPWGGEIAHAAFHFAHGPVVLDDLLCQSSLQESAVNRE